MSGDQLNLDEVEDLCAIVRDEEQRTWHERQDALWQLLDVGGTVPAMVAEVRRLREALDGRGVVLRDAYNDATRTRDAHVRRALRAETELAALRASIAAQA